MEAGSSTEQLGRYLLLFCPRFASFLDFRKNFPRIHVAKSLRLSHVGNGCVFSMDLRIGEKYAYDFWILGVGSCWTRFAKREKYIRVSTCQDGLTPVRALVGLPTRMGRLINANNL
jgi:hypothetical protein